MMTQLIRVGILGAGSFAARRHLPDLIADERVQVVAACRRDETALAQFSDHFQIPERYTDWHEMLEKSQLDGVLIATPHDQHFEQAKTALEQGLHVLLEKPMALHLSEAEELVKLANLLGLTLAVGVNPPYWRHTNLLRDGITAGQIGTLEHVTLSWSGSAEAIFGRVPMPDQSNAIVKPTMFRGDPNANGGGFLMDVGPHVLSELLWVTGQEAMEVTAIMDDPNADMRSALTIKLSGGALVTVAILGDSHHSARRVRSDYYGSSGDVVSEALPFLVKWSSDTEPIPEEQMPEVPTPVADWIESQVIGKTPLGSPDHALSVTRLLLAAYEAATTKQSIIITTL